MKILNIIKILIILCVICSNFLLNCEGDNNNVKTIVDLIMKVIITFMISRTLIFSLEPYLPKKPVSRKDLSPEDQQKRDEEIEEMIKALIKEEEENHG